MSKSTKNASFIEFDALRLWVLQEMEDSLTLGEIVSEGLGLPVGHLGSVDVTLAIRIDRMMRNLGFVRLGGLNCHSADRYGRPPATKFVPCYRPASSSVVDIPEGAKAIHLALRKFSEKSSGMVVVSERHPVRAGRDYTGARYTYRLWPSRNGIIFAYAWEF